MKFIQFELAIAENAALEQQFSTGALSHTCTCVYAGPQTNPMCCSTVPTKDQVLVPETLLKKRKSQEKARAEKQAEIENKKKVSSSRFGSARWGRRDAYHI
jgi:hypothetical protein